ncbi:hypothetical protein, conserved in T. vivax [Trypanosoma vivax Y486]|uniref:Uncharacterized protein n=1 Tax=Trypanosoma vivax (strain Y486) TaxID=1055687 RepID=F9WQI3_TRYVY|nr:hypothetical protein, conserved in T. vivax [Trypanosoma vivax Y486]|eukprot:CCD19811.1 hypothetical protein, conserved in T. vivax [Trypanosoma vivax Y486]
MFAPPAVRLLVRSNRAHAARAVFLVLSCEVHATKPLLNSHLPASLPLVSDASAQHALPKCVVPPLQASMTAFFCLCIFLPPQCVTLPLVSGCCLWLASVLGMTVVPEAPCLSALRLFRLSPVAIAALVACSVVHTLFRWCCSVLLSVGAPRV